MAPKYTAVPNTDEDDSNLSSPSLDNNRKSRVLLLCFFIALASSIATNVFLFFSRRPGHDRQCTSTVSPPPLSPSSSWTSIWGEVPMITSTWQSFTAYSEPGDEATELWHALLNPAQGLIRIPSPGLHALPPSYLIPNDTDAAEIYMTSGAHQLHCLTMLRTYISAHSAPTSLNPSTPPTSPIPTPRAIHQSHTPIPHLHHCLDYLRQAIICTADTTLEVVDYVVPVGADGVKDDDAAGFEIDSAATARTCRDWSVMRGVMDGFGIQVRSER